MLTVFENAARAGVGPEARYSPALARESGQSDLDGGMGRAATTPVSLLPATPRQPLVLESLPPFPVIALRVAQLMSNDNARIKELCDLIRADQSLSAEVLRLANSPLFGFRTEITSILRAVALLGHKRIRGLAVTAGIQSYLARPLKVPALQLCWQHSLATAIAAEKLARVAFVEGDSAYTAGLLHDIGRLALIAAQPDHYAQLLAAVEEGSLDVLECERKWFGMDHCEAGQRLVEKWRLPAGSIGLKMAGSPLTARRKASPQTWCCRCLRVVTGASGWALPAADSTA